MKEEIMKSHNVVLIFLDRHENYHSAYKYICKSDTQVCHSKHHPNLKDVGSPVTKNPPRLYVQDAKKDLSKKLMNLLMALQSHHVVRLNVFLIWVCCRIFNIQQYPKGCRIDGCCTGTQRGRSERFGKLYLFQTW